MNVPWNECSLQLKHRYLLSQGADIHARDNAGFTALHWAGIKGKTKASKSLVRIYYFDQCQLIISLKLRDRTIEVAAVDKNNETPAQMAQRKGFHKLAKDLQKDEKRKAIPPEVTTIFNNKES
jgi:ankyrin repeat protein